jgi:hypothetical protein
MFRLFFTCLLAVMAIVALTACSPAAKKINRPPDNGVYATASIEGLDLSLVDRGGRCTLLYKGTGAEKELDLDMAVPCDFIRAKWSEYQPQVLYLGEGNEKRGVMFITGGPPHPTVKDDFQPGGCGTDLAKINVFSDRVEIAWFGPNQPPHCPSQEMDMVMFGS